MKNFVPTLHDRLTLTARYKIVQRDDALEAGDYKLLTVHAGGPEKTGVSIACTEKTVVCALFDEPKGKFSFSY